MKKILIVLLVVLLSSCYSNYKIRQHEAPTETNYSYLYLVTTDISGYNTELMAFYKEVFKDDPFTLDNNTLRVLSNKNLGVINGKQ